MKKELQFVSPSKFQILGKTKDADLSNIGILKSGPAVTIKAIDRENRIIDFIISTAAVDRDNDTISIDGWDLANYKSNPVVLFAHDHWQMPVARSRQVFIADDSLQSKAEFTPKDLYPFGFMVFEFYANDFMRATSVGFKPQEWAYDEGRKYGVNFSKQELLEYSTVPVPSNPEALMQARAKGIDTNPLKAWCEQYLDDEKLLKDGKLDMGRPALERIRELASASGSPTIIDFGAMKSQLEAKPTPVPDPSKALVKTVQPLQQWGCKNAEHTHRTENEAELCEVRAAVEPTVIATVGAARPAVKAEVITEKAGRVLSAANETRLRGAATKGEEMAALIREVLAQLDEEEDDEEEGKTAKAETDAEWFPVDKDPDDLDITEAQLNDAIASVVGEGLKSEINAITGRVD